MKGAQSCCEGDVYADSLDCGDGFMHSLVRICQSTHFYNMRAYGMRIILNKAVKKMAASHCP